MKILLISPLIAPIRKPAFYNIGLGYIAASLIQEGHDINVLDIEGYRYSKEKVLDIIKNIECDIIGIGTIITGYKYVKWLTKEIKRLKPNVPIILGNSIGSTIPETALTDLDIDFVVIGEGEITIKELVKAIEAKSDLTDIKGICFKKNGEIKYTAERELIENIDSIPMPAWDLFPQKIYMNNLRIKNYLPQPCGCIVSSRGCPYHCTYCYHPFQNKKVRFHSPERIISELKILKQKYNIKSFLLADDLSIVNRNRIFKLCELLEKENLNLKWQAVGRVNLIDEELLKKMKYAGCQIVGFGIESGSQKILDNIKKQVTVKQAKKAIYLCKKVGLYPSTSFMIGNVGETRETALKSVYFITKYLDEPKVFFVATPYPETELFQYGEEHGLIKDKIKLFESYGEQSTQVLINFTNMSDAELMALKSEVEKIIRKFFKRRIVYIKEKIHAYKNSIVRNIRELGLKKTIKKSKIFFYSLIERRFSILN